MKRFLVLVLILSMVASCVACGKNEEKNSANIEPQISQMKAICELAVMECYYHTVAKYYEKDAEKGFLGLGSKDKEFWVEYSGVVDLGIDITLVKLEVKDAQITVTLPEAKVLDCKVDSTSLNKDSYIVAKDSADIVADDETNAFKEAESKIIEEASNDKILLANAQQRAQVLLEEYITNIGNAVGKQYSITWDYISVAEEKKQ